MKVPGGSRYQRYAIELRRSAESEAPPDAERLAIWHRAMIELYDLEGTVRVLAAPPEVVGWRERVQETLSGGVRRADEVRHSRARDIQFEIAVATLLRQAGFRVAFAEPDVVGRRGDREFAFAVKRPRSPAKIGAHIRTANEQMIRVGKSGLVAIDITCVVSPSDRTFITKDPAATYNLLAQVANDFGSRNALAVRGAVDTDYIYGILVHVALPVADAADRSLGYIRRWSVTSLLHEEDPRTRALKGLAKRFADAVGRLTLV